MGDIENDLRHFSNALMSQIKTLSTTEISDCAKLYQKKMFFCFILKKIIVNLDFISLKIFCPNE